MKKRGFDSLLVFKIAEKFETKLRILIQNTNQRKSCGFSILNLTSICCSNDKMSNHATCAGMYLGTVIAMPLAGILAEHINWESIFYVFGGK